MEKIIFVCHGNICRSPMAEFIMKDMLNKANISGIEVCSRAMRRDEIGSDLYPPAKRTLDAHGVPYSKHTATLMTKADYDSGDIIAVMDEENYRDMERLVPRPGKVKKLMSFAGIERDVADPWYTRDFEVTYKDIAEGCKGIIESIKKA